jgi:predicted MFS family arabinose efflux permease
LDTPVTTATTLRVGGVSRSYILWMVMLVYVVNYIDRTILAIILPEIKHEFSLTDFQSGLLSGTSFAITYATLGMPLAWLADRVNRRNIIAFSMALFSAATVVCAYAANALQLVAARIFTGVGEAGTGPSIQSIISDLYEPKERAAALSFYSAGLNIGLLIAFFVGGQIEAFFGWRAAFLAAGIPGLVLFILFMFTVPEPRRGHVEQLADAERAPGLIKTFAVLWAQPTFRWMSVGCGLSAFGGYAGITFTPLFLSVSHGMTPGPRGLALALLTGVAGGLGTYFSGVLADRFSRNNLRWNLYVPILFVVISLPFMPFFYLSPSLTVALAAAIIPTAAGAAYVSPAYAVTLRLVPLRMRAQAAAILLFILNIIGYGLGPAGVGALSDALRPSLGSDSIRWAMLATSITWILAGICFWRASRTVVADVQRSGGDLAGPLAVPA